MLGTVRTVIRNGRHFLLEKKSRLMGISFVRQLDVIDVLFLRVCVLGALISRKEERIPEAQRYQAVLWMDAITSHIETGYATTI